MTEEELERIAKDWYTGQRGRVNGNTVAWDDLDPNKKWTILECVKETLDYMKEAWQWPQKH